MISSESTLFVKVKKIFRQKNAIIFENYNLTPLESISIQRVKDCKTINHIRKPRQNVQTQFRCSRMWHPIRVITVCLQNVLVRIEMKNTTLTQKLRVDSSNSQECERRVK